MKNLVIIGAGASGLMAGIAARNVLGKNELKITLIEKNSRPARKLMITGKGRCNVTNNCEIDALVKNTVRNGRFMYSAFSLLSPADTMSLFENLGVPLKTERGNRVFPVSDRAVDIVDALQNANKKSGNMFICATAEKIITEDNKIKGVILDNGEEIKADALIIATGGMSYPLTGSTGDGYKFARELRHTVTKLSPSLIPLECFEGFCSSLSGLTLKNVTLSIIKRGAKKPVFSQLGELLFTHFGISGPLVLSASAYLDDPNSGEYEAQIDLKPALSGEMLDKRILRDFSDEPNKDIQNVLFKLLPKSLVPVVLNLSDIPKSTKVNSVTKEQRRSLIDVIKNLKLHIIASRPIEEAVITRGGVSVKEIEPSSMRSKIIDNLYFAGEIMDVDAFTGGFNLQIAFSSGNLAGIKSAEKLKES